MLLMVLATSVEAERRKFKWFLITFDDDNAKTYNNHKYSIIFESLGV